MLLATGQAAMARLVPQFHTSINSATIILTILILIILIMEECRRLVIRRGAPKGVSKALPGPWGVPVLGNILQLGSAPHETFMKMADKYGDVFQIHIGSRPVVVLNGYDTIRQALVKQGVDFAGRPDLTSTRCMNTILGSTLAFTSYSEGWKMHRKITESSVRHFTSGRQLSSVGACISKEAQALIDVWTVHFNKDNKGKDTKNGPFDILKLSVSNVMYSYMFSKSHSLDDQKLLDFVAMSDNFSKAIGTGNPADFMPWMKPFSKKIFDNFEKMMYDYKSWFGADITKHTKEYKSESESNILDYLITMNRRMDPEDKERLHLTEETIVNTVYDVFGAGFETVSALLQWTIAIMIMYPDVQREIQKELDEVVGRDRVPCASDRKQLPITESCLLEIIRISSVVPMTIPHSTTRDTELNGYFIPKDTVVFVNLHSLNYDKKTWDNPGEFRPRRFLREDGTSLDPTKTISVMPFGAGKRRCIGSELARLEFFLYSSTLLQQCTFEANGDKPSLKSSPGLVQKPSPFSMTVSKRELNIPTP